MNRMGMNIGKCFGIDGNEITFAEWAALIESGARRVARTEIGNGYVSTVWLGIDHGFGQTGRPLIFESMKFPENDPVERYETRDQALEGHARMVAQCEVSG